MLTRQVGIMDVWAAVRRVSERMLSRTETYFVFMLEASWAVVYLNEGIQASQDSEYTRAMGELVVSILMSSLGATDRQVSTFRESS